MYVRTKTAKKRDTACNELHKIVIPRVSFTAKCDFNLLLNTRKSSSYEIDSASWLPLLIVR
jgi:hypothetical protein